MTDDKAIKAALDAYRITPKVTCSVHETQVIRMRAALSLVRKGE